MLTMYMSGAQGGQEVVPDPLELELPMAVWFHVGVENEDWVLWKSSQGF